jgi:hypothetical protein
MDMSTKKSGKTLCRDLGIALNSSEYGLMGREFHTPADAARRPRAVVSSRAVGTALELLKPLVERAETRSGCQPVVFASFGTKLGKSIWLTGAREAAKSPMVSGAALR